ncbi:hypothetical protein M0L20_17105 [Spirosoma sp. RP8]|uniref:Uncharacterized protein n=1 Tax=Spirosoma liriopis TaxID=2937440 RepID=A0ABT0HN78_9BACT|nr:hypothetical protein [Spirosoma liriopis]MCK8493587.1 hypothetical protein [Spirosoma liriopis]
MIFPYGIGYLLISVQELFGAIKTARYQHIPATNPVRSDRGGQCVSTRMRNFIVMQEA